MESPTAWSASDVRLVRDINYPDNITLLLPPPLPSPPVYPWLLPGLCSFIPFPAAPAVPSRLAGPGNGSSRNPWEENISFLYKTPNMLRPHSTDLLLSPTVAAIFPVLHCSTQFLPGYSRFQPGVFKPQTCDSKSGELSWQDKTILADSLGNVGPRSGHYEYLLTNSTRDSAEPWWEISFLEI